MGKGQGKKGRKEDKLAVKKPNQEPKIPGLPKPEKPAKRAAAISALPLGQQRPFTKKPQHAKWPALFKRHLGVIESHVKNLDRVMQSTKSEMDRMDEKDRLEWELGERGNWRVICEMMDRAREVLVSAKKAARGILPEGYLRDKKGLGVSGTTFEPLGPKLAARAAELGFIGDPNKGLGRDIHAAARAGATDSDGDSEITDTDSSSSSSSGDDNVAPGADFVPLNIGKEPHAATAEDGDKDAKETSTSVVEPNPYFIIDTKPTPVVLNGNSVEKKSKKRAKKEAQDERKAKKVKGEKKPEPQPEDPAPVEAEVDFAALEAKLQAEVAAGEKAQEEQALAETTSAEEKKSKKKRRRSSNGDEEVVKKKAKKEKKDKKEKKRKVDNGADGEEVDGGKKKKRKHHVDDTE